MALSAPSSLFSTMSLVFLFLKLQGESQVPVFLLVLR
jgi:hypothetical protein